MLCSGEMQRSKRIFLTLMLAVLAVPALKLFANAADSSGVFLRRVNQGEIRAGEILTITGRALDSAHVRGIFLTNGETDFHVEILTQASDTIQLRVPSSTPAGHMHFALMRANRDDVLDQPVYLKILPALGTKLI